MKLTKQLIEDMRTSLGKGAQPFTKDAIDSLCELAQSAVPEVVPTEGFTLEDVHTAISRALDEANVKTEAYRGMCIIAGLDALPDGSTMNVEKE